MKSLLYIAILVSLSLEQSCQNNKMDVGPRLETQADSLGGAFFAERIPLDELPVPVKDGIKKSELFSGLTISSIIKIRGNDITYYDMTFRDFDGQLIMVYYDEQGRIIVP